MDNNFDHLKLKQLIGEVYGERSYKDFFTQAQISNTVFYEVIGGKRHPSRKTWIKIEKAFKKKNIILNYADFLTNKSEFLISSSISEPLEKYNDKEENAIIEMLMKDLENAHTLIEEKNKIIINQSKEITQLKKKINDEE